MSAMASVQLRSAPAATRAQAGCAARPVRSFQASVAAPVRCMHAPRIGRRHAGAARLHAVAEGSRASAGASTDKKEWYALLANADFYFNDVQNEAMAEQLREQQRYYDEQGRKTDFWFAVEPAWLERFPAEAKRVRRPAVALVSPDKEWITFMKLRLDRVLRVELGPMTEEEAAKSTAPMPEFKPPEKWTAPYAPYASGWWERYIKK